MTLTRRQLTAACVAAGGAFLSRPFHHRALTQARKGAPSAGWRDTGPLLPIERRGQAATNALPVQSVFAEIDQALDAEAGVYGVMVVDQKGMLRYSRNAGLPFISASLYKLMLATDILRRIELGEIDRDQFIYLDPWYFEIEMMPDGAYGYDAAGTEITVEEALWASICVSSNVSSLALLSLTSGEAMNTLAGELGLSTTVFGSDLFALPFWPPPESRAESVEQLQVTIGLVESASTRWAVNLTSPADMAKLMHSVLRGAFVSPWVSAELMALLLDQQINDRMPALLPEGTPIAHKTGNLISIVHDAGAIMTDEGPILLALLSQGVPDEPRATRVLQSIAAMVYARLIQQ